MNLWWLLILLPIGFLLAFIRGACILAGRADDSSEEQWKAGK